MSWRDVIVMKKCHIYMHVCTHESNTAVKYSSSLFYHSEPTIIPRSLLEGSSSHLSPLCQALNKCHVGDVIKKTCRVIKKRVLAYI